MGSCARAPERGKETRGRGETIAALVLFREGAHLLARAAVTNDQSPHDAADPTALAAKLIELLEGAGTHSPSDLGRLGAVLSSSDPCVIDRLGIGERELAAADLDASTHWLSELLVAPSRTVLRTRRALRNATAAGIGLGAVVLTWALVTRPLDLALHRPARASSQAFGTTPAGAVDGIRYGQLGFHSDLQDQPWLSIDLGSDYAIDRVQVYGRGDCCFDQSVPLVFEVSEDGAAYRRVDVRDAPFSQEEPWIIKPKGLLARFVRLRTLRRSVLVLSEVEAYGRKR
jgi:hypothetical protein